jgi:pimeloyl-ACP methyl ester carboxylesterase
MLSNDVRLPDPEAEREARVIRLDDGRALACTQWGEPDGYPALYFHGTPGSRFEGAFADHAARTHGFRIMAIDRPGYGRSTFQEDRRFQDWPKDVCALADALAVDDFGVVGHSGAGPHLFACGAFIPATRLTFVGALAPWGPVANPEVMASLNAPDRFFAMVSRRLPWIMRGAFAPLGWCARYWPGMFLALLRSYLSPADKEVMKDPQFVAHLGKAEMEAFRQGSRGGAHDAFIAYREWDFEIEKVASPTHIWLGDEDVFVPSRMGEYLERAIPDVDFHWAQGKGHLNIELWDDILAACATHI